MRALKKLGKHKESDELDFDIDGDDDEPLILHLPSQTSADDTSNWNNRVSTSPDGREHIKELGSDDQVKK